MKQSKKLRLPSELLNCFENFSPEVSSSLKQIYGEGYANLENKRRIVISMLKTYINEFGNEPILISRAPGRVNIMGRHVDHQGGFGNMMAIDKDIYCLIGSRSDRQINLINLDKHKFPDRKFLIDDLTDSYKGSWLDFINNDVIKERVITAQGDWAQYVKGTVARFQTKYPEKVLKGMNILVSGDIPIAAGLSSSSALFVSVVESIIELNDIKITSQEFVELCAEGEWYVGTRGGAGDHAAMKFGKRGQVVQLSYFPIEVADYFEFPEDYLLVLCNSHEKARKTAGAKDIFNHRVACYHIGREILKKEFPEYASRIEHLRDINVKNLNINYSDLLRLIKQLPNSLNRNEIIGRLSNKKAVKYLITHSESLDRYPLRSIVIYGITEIERSRNILKLLKSGNVDEFGRWMNISHNGDRVASYKKGENELSYNSDYSDIAMDNLIAKAEKSNDEINLCLLAGYYGCSIPQIDQMVDIALTVRGVKGAQIAGAGLGGCIMVLVEKDAYGNLEKALIKRYYEPKNLEPDIFVCHPTKGSGLVYF